MAKYLGDAGLRDTVDQSNQPLRRKAARDGHAEKMIRTPDAESIDYPCGC